MSPHGLEEVAAESIVDGRYLVRREIAHGGVACVFEAEHIVTRAKLALKALRQQHLGRPDAHERLLREARVLGALRHPNIVLIQDAGACPKHGPFLALQMIDGRPLDGILIARRSLPAGQAVAVALQLCHALETVHRSGVVHRDVKPSNLLISRTATSDQVVLIDFGVATAGSEDAAASPKLTKMGELLGTIEYMSPEQLMESAPIDERTDVYAAGVVLYECLSGEVPFAGSATAVITSFIQGIRPASLRERGVAIPAALEAALNKALEIDPGGRYPSTHDFAAACRAALGDVVPEISLLDVQHDQLMRAATQTGARPVLSASKPAVSESVQRRRQFLRAPYVTPVRILLGPNRACDGRSEDISEGGVLVVADTECATDQRVKVRLPLPTSGRVVVLDATTKWCKASRNQRAIGIEFFDPPEDVRAEIRAYAELMARLS
jgi:serine/threonine protein kinase